MSSDPIAVVCPVCASYSARLVRKYRYHQPIFAGCSIVQCNNCKMVFVHPMPDEATLEKYNAGYFSNAHGGISIDKLTIAFHSAINRLRVLHVDSFAKLHNINIQNVLEIGPGGGHFARHWRSIHGEQKRYTGVESDTSCHNSLRASGITVYNGVSELPADTYYDLVVISHVLEHTNAPRQFLADSTKWLSPGGVLFIEVPCNDFAHKDSDEPHLLFFDKDPMQLLLTKTGFEQIHLSYHGEKITELKKKRSFYTGLMQRLRNVLLRKGIIAPFSVAGKELQGVDDPLERAVIKPFKAQIEQPGPAWWLRAVAIKK